MPAVPMGAHLPPPCLPLGQTLPRGAAAAMGLPGSYSVPRSQKTTGRSNTVGHGCAASPMCSVGPACPRAPRGLESKAGCEHSRGGLGESVLLRGCSLGTWQQHPVPPELGQNCSPMPCILIQGAAVYPWELPKLWLCAAEGPLSIENARPPQDFAF